MFASFVCISPNSLQPFWFGFGTQPEPTVRFGVSVPYFGSDRDGLLRDTAKPDRTEPTKPERRTGGRNRVSTEPRRILRWSEMGYAWSICTI